MTNEQGRPRDARIDAAALDAAAALLLEVGYADLTLAAVATRAGTSRPAVYRRWPTKAHLVHETVFRGEDTEAPASSGDLATDVAELVRRTARMLTSPLARLAVPGLVGEAAGDPDLNRRVLERFEGTGWRGLQETVAEAVARGELDDHVDVLHLLELAIGACLAASLIRGPEALDD
ncbi:MAG: TetR/AcrR family transcriptional regulator, partial [Nocardioides sp.]|nr:TetR/AcrR family transcriptional regulator [Nocardioides sp.]